MRRVDGELLAELITKHLGVEVTVIHVNDGEGHRRMLAYNRAVDRAWRRSRRNQPPGRARS